MPRLCYRKSTNEVINDFQSNPSSGTLIKNAVNAKLGKESDFEEREVTEQEYLSAIEVERQRAQPRISEEVAKREGDLLDIRNKLSVMGFTSDQIKVLLKEDQ